MNAATIMVAWCFGTAEAAEGYGWVAADQPYGAFPYLPAVQDHVDGWLGSVQHFFPGWYQVRLPELGRPAGVWEGYDDGNTQVTAWGTDASYCKLDHVTTDGPTRVVNVVCYDAAGHWVDSKFSALYQSYVADEFLPSVGQAAYAWHLGFYDYNTFDSDGGWVTTTPISTGRYQVTFDHMDMPGGSILVTAVGGGPERCKVEGWYGASNKTVATVLCHAPSGALANSAFQISYVDEMTLARSAPANGLRRGAYAWTGGGTAGTTSLSSVWSAWDYAFSTAVPSGNVGTRTRVSPGRYNVRFYGLGGGLATPLVTAYGSDAHHCKVGGWTTVGTAAEVDVRCFDTYGTPADSYFTIAFQGA